MTNKNTIDQASINTLRFLSVEMIEKANSGHPGLPLGAAPMAYTLFSRHMNFNPNEPDWINRDRFILSAGHGSALLYSLLHLYGYDLSMEEIKNFRQLGSITPGHPEYGITPGVDASTGPLGQGIAMGVGMAIGQSKMAEDYNKEDISLFDNYTYILCGDGDLMEGISYEAMSLAGSLKLDKLIILYDSNNITIEGTTDDVFEDDIKLRMEASGFHYQRVEDGNNIDEIDAAIQNAKEENSKPSFIEVVTQIGYGVPGKVGTPDSHGAPLGLEHMEAMREYFTWEDDEFSVSDDVKDHIKSQLEEKKQYYDKWQEAIDSYESKYEADYKDLQDYLNHNLDEEYFENSFADKGQDAATRSTSGKAIDKISKKCKFFLGGSADLAPSNKTRVEDSTSYKASDRSGRNFRFGVREHAMGAIANGLALYAGAKVYTATFLVFSDYMKAAMRMSALMNIANVYVMTHDSIGVGEDGPTHQPIEQLAMLRSIPNMQVIRPADDTETYYGWKYALESKTSPVTLALTRQDLPSLENSGKGLSKGAYIIGKEEHDLHAIIIASGSEVHLALEAKDILEKEGLGIRVVSMPSMNLFEAQDQAYKDEILPREITNRVTVEAGSTFGWDRYAGLDGIKIGIDTFGESGPADEVYDHFGITSQRIVEAVKSLKK